MKINTLAGRLVVLAISLALPGFAMAGSPTDVVQGTVVEVRSTLAVQDSGAELTPEQILKVSRVLGKRFSFREMARLTLGQHWQSLSPQERTEPPHFLPRLPPLTARHSGFPQRLTR